MVLLSEDHSEGEAYLPIYSFMRTGSVSIYSSNFLELIKVYVLKLILEKFRTDSNLLLSDEAFVYKK